MKYSFSNSHFPKEIMTPKLSTVNPICLDILYNRGITDPKAMEEVLFPSLLRALQRYPKLKDMDEAVNILEMAVKNKQSIVVYHDYDADGITSAATFTACMAPLGVPVYLYSNSRTVGGFGICPEGVNAIKEKYPDVKVLVTVDNGISGYAGVARAKDLGFQVIVTDHHEQNESLPGADAIVDPKRDDEPEAQYRDSCGAGVIWDVMLALYSKIGQDITPVMDALDIVALGTISDVVPLVSDKNRAIVRQGLKLICDGKRPFFRAMRELFKFDSFTSEIVSFKITPMINAVSRMEKDASLVVNLILCTDPEKLREGLIYLDDINNARRAESDREIELAEKGLLKQPPKGIIIFRDNSLKEGIVGIVAGKLKESYGLPTMVFAPDGKGNWKGSCRAPEGFHLKEALDSMSDILLSYGGHAKAAGVTVPDAFFDELEQRMTNLASEATIKEDVVPIDVVLSSEDYTEKLCHELSVLEPYGEGFRKPVFGLVADVVGVRFMGNEQQHVKYLDKTGLSIVKWNSGEQARARQTTPKKFVGYPSLNIWNGNVSVQFICD